MSVTPSPIGGFAAQFFDNNGVILSGGKIYTYAAGTTTPQATYTSASGTTAHANPIILDSAGRVPGGEIWLTDGLVYKFVIETATAILIGTYDNITGVNSNFLNYTVQEEVQTATAGQTVFTLATMNYAPGTNSLTVYIDGVNQYVGESYLETDGNTVTFTSGVHVGGEVKFTTAIQTTTGAVDASIVSYNPPFTGAVGTNVEDKLAQTVSVMDFGAVGDGVTDDTNAIKAAVLAANSIYFPPGTYLISSTIYTRGAIDATGRYKGKKLFGAGITATTIKAKTGFTDSYMIHIGNKDYVTNNNYCVGNQLSDMTIDNFAMGDTVFDCAVITVGTYNNLIQNLQIGVVAFPYTRWDLAIDRGTYTTNVFNVNCQQMQLATSVIGDVTTIWVKGCSVTFLNVYGANGISFDGLTVQGSTSVQYQANRVQVSNSNNVSFINGDLEGDGTMFSIADSSGIWIENNNVAMPGSYTPYLGAPTSSVFFALTNTSQVLSRDNIFMNWNQGPLGAGAGTYYTNNGGNARLQIYDFQGAYFTGSSYAKVSASSFTSATPTTVNYDSVIFDIYNSVTTGASWHYTTPFRAAYQVSAAIRLTGYDATTDIAYLAILSNGVEIYRAYAAGSMVGNNTQIVVSGVVLALANQQISVQVYSNSASPGIDAQATANYCSINLINVY